MRDQLAAGKTLAIIPIGGTEQNGPHMAIGKHNLRVKLLAGKIAARWECARRAGVAYVPEGGLNPPTGHMRFPGTITVPEETFEKTLEYAARSFSCMAFATSCSSAITAATQKDEEAVADPQPGMGGDSQRACMP